MFEKWMNAKKLEKSIVSKKEFYPYPNISNRRAWNELPDDVQASIISEGERYFNFTWPDLTGSMYMEFSRTGNRTIYEDSYHSRRRGLTSLVLAECMENDGKYLDDIINGIWSICEESTWVTPSHHHMSLQEDNVLPGLEAHFIDIFAAETASTLSWVYYLLKPSLDSIDRMISKRIHYEVKSRVLDVYLKYNDFWWMGFDSEQKLNNWTPWCTSNILSAFLFLEEDRMLRGMAVNKALFSLERFLDFYHEDGGCDEGPGYWNKAGGSLFDCLELIYISTKEKIDYYHEPLIQKIGSYIHKVHIHDDYFINFADCPPKVIVEADLLYRFGKRIEDEKLSGLGLNVHRKYGIDNIKQMKFFSFLRMIPALFNVVTMNNDYSQYTVQKDVWLNDIQVMVARESLQSDKGLYLASKGGNNDESHNHNDVGNMILYADGVPVLVDIGVGTYTAKTFSSDRYDIWTMQSDYHNLPSINGLQQQAGKAFKAKEVGIVYNDDGRDINFSLDIALSYPKESGINYWFRNLYMDRSNDTAIKLEDQFSFVEKAKNVKWHFISSYKPEIKPDCSVILHYGQDKAIHMKFLNQGIELTYEKVQLDDEELKVNWNGELYRIVALFKDPIMEGKLPVRMKKIIT